ncbi:DNA polymerase lambda-like isoform X2 [Mercenaria mercenaria]|uniref:DNA polymerase lambda-like isoform X2 n=1 Tax=Mercenaria mercenaria TaxID=6596 RepID=UPI00234F4C7C|nr:DNA polymerase lambda-like isoform X2 [Mercenaria mercenaria]
MESNKRPICSQSDGNESKKRKIVRSSENKEKPANFLASLHVFILQAGIEKMRMNIFKTQLEKYGGNVLNDLTDVATHLVVDDKMEADRMCRLLKVSTPPTGICIVKSSWLSGCFRQKALLDSSEFLLDCSKFTTTKTLNSNSGDNGTEHPSSSKSSDLNTADDSELKPEFPKVGVMFGHKTKANHYDSEDSDYCPSGEESELETDYSTPSTTTTPSTSPKKNLPVGNWVCAQSSKTAVENCNKHITDKLEEMVRTYESTNDKWRAFGYQKAIQVLKKQSKPITSYEEAMALPSIGKRLAEKIWEIAESGELRKLNELRSSDEIKVIEMFKDVWGAGAHTARTWYQQGFRTLEDLRTKANLTHQQKVGLRCYDDILDRMPRSEAGEIEKVVKDAAESLQEGIICQACGSYRRGKATCGDVDILVTHPDGKSHKGIFAKLLAKLKDQGMHNKAFLQTTLSQQKITGTKRNIWVSVNYLAKVESIDAWILLSSHMMNMHVHLYILLAPPTSTDLYGTSQRKWECRCQNIP